MPSAPSAQIPGLVAPFLENPAGAAVLTDIDGTLAPIVERAEDAAIPAEARRLLADLAGRYALVGCISGRRAEEAKSLVGLDDIAYSGNHGLELLLPGEEHAAPEPSLVGHQGAAADYLRLANDRSLADAGLRVEEKGPIQALHWRGVPDEAAAEARARAIAADAEEAGLATHWGRKVLELRPPGGAGKDQAVAALLAAKPVSAAAYAGDDRTDLDAFRALREAVAREVLETALCVGVDSAEGPPELAEHSDLLVDGTTGWLEVLRALAA